MVQGDTNTAMAAAQAANYAGVPVVHVEAGLRSFDRAHARGDQPLRDRRAGRPALRADRRAAANLAAEGVPGGRIALTGNTIVEATLAMLPGDEAARQIAAAAGAEPGRYVLATIHRPENTDDPLRLGPSWTSWASWGCRCCSRCTPGPGWPPARHGLAAALDRLRMLPPADHRTFLGLARHARLLVSDSGGVQEECTVLKRPLIVVRNSTERPESVEAGFAHLVQPGPVIGELGRQLIGDDPWPRGWPRSPCPFGDGTASEQIAGLLAPTWAERQTGPGLAAGPRSSLLIRASARGREPAAVDEVVGHAGHADQSGHSGADRRGHAGQRRTARQRGLVADAGAERQGLRAAEQDTEIASTVSVPLPRCSAG